MCVFTSLFQTSNGIQFFIYLFLLFSSRIPHPEVGQPLLSSVYGQSGVQSEVIAVAVLQQVVEQHCAALARLHLEARPVRALGEGRLSPRIGTLHVAEVQQQGEVARLRVAAHPPVVMRVVLLAVPVVHHLDVLRVVPVQPRDLEQVLGAHKQGLYDIAVAATEPAVATGARLTLEGAGLAVPHDALGHAGLRQADYLRGLEVVQEVLNDKCAGLQ